MVSATRLLRALERSAAAHGCAPELTLAATRPWASALYVGARYDVTAVLDSGAAAECWLAALPDAELPMPRQYASEVRVLAREDAERITVLIEAVVLEE